MEFVVFKAYQLCIEQSVLDVFVAEHFHDMKDVFCFCVFHCGFPMSECVEVDFVYAVVFEFERYFCSLDSEGSGEVSVAACEGFGFFFWQAV